MTRLEATLLCAFLVMLGLTVPSSAQSQIKEKTVGAWRAFENLGHTGDNPPKGILNVAETPALNGRRADLGIDECTTYSVHFRLGADSEFNTALESLPRHPSP